MNILNLFKKKKEVIYHYYPTKEIYIEVLKNSIERFNKDIKEISDVIIDLNNLKYEDYKKLIRHEIVLNLSKECERLKCNISHDKSLIEDFNNNITEYKQIKSKKYT